MLFEIDDCPIWAKEYHTIAKPTSVRLTNLAEPDQSSKPCILFEGFVDQSSDSYHTYALTVEDAIRLAIDLLNAIDMHHDEKTKK